MKEYTVYFYIKRNGHGYLKHHTVNAKNKKEAFAMIEEYSQENFERHAFWKSTEVPSTDSKGKTVWQGTWTRSYGNVLY